MKRNLTWSRIYEESLEKAENMCCPDCESEHVLEFADEEVLVCKVCGYSIEHDELSSEWEEKLSEDYGLYD